MASPARLSPGARALAWAGFVGALFLSFPHPLAGGVLDLGAGLAWLAAALLCVALEGLPPGRAARQAFLAGTLAYGLVLHWIFVVTVIYGHAPAFVGVLAPLLLALYMAVPLAGFAAGSAWLRQRNLAGPVVLAVAFAATEHARSFFLTGFPWASLGYAHHLNPGLRGLAAWTGVYGLSLVTMLGGAALAELLLARRAGAPPPRRALAAGLGVVVLHGLGWLGRPPPAPPDAPTIRIAALQGDIGQGNKWSPEWVGHTIERYSGLAREARADGARLLVWPETAVPGAPDVDPVLQERLSSLARETGSAQVIGSVGVSLDASADAVRYFDSAFVVEADGTWTVRYDKSHLVPFGEYIPFRAVLGHFLSAVARGIASTDVSPGPRPAPVSLEVPGHDGPPVMVGVPICYELLFPDLTRRFVGGGGRLLLAITNDAWYGRTGAPHQFLAMTAMRAAETGTWTVRAANTGVSAIIDGQGRVRSRTALFEPAWIAADVPLAPAPPAPDATEAAATGPAAGGAAGPDGAGRGPTFYARHGDWLPRSCWGATALFGVVAWRRGRRRVDPPVASSGGAEETPLPGARPRPRPRPRIERGDPA